MVNSEGERRSAGRGRRLRSGEAEGPPCAVRSAQSQDAESGTAAENLTVSEGRSR